MQRDAPAARASTEDWRNRPWTAPAVTLVLMAPVVLWIYARTSGYGLFSDDYQWLAGAAHFDAWRLVDISHRNHFFRPLMELYFPAALAGCGHAEPCFHWLSIALHVGTSLLVALLAGAIARTPAIGVLAGVLFAVLPGPVEAVTWVSAVSEVIVTGLFVLTLWLFRRAVEMRVARLYVFSVVAFIASLMAHESAVTLLPVMALSMWLLPIETPAAEPGTAMRRPRMPLLMWAPFALALAVFGVVTYIVNSRNYVVTEGQYAIGFHVLSNVLGAIVTLAVARREWISLAIVGACVIWTTMAAPPRMRFYAMWIVITLVPFAGFHAGVTSRYLYLPAAGFAGLTAEILWSARGLIGRWPRAGAALWWGLVAVLTLRFAAFGVKNVRAWEDAAVPFQMYADVVRDLEPAPARGAKIEVPAPTARVPVRYVEPLLQWTFKDPELVVNVRLPLEAPPASSIR